MRDAPVPQKYDAVAIVLHWSSALFIVTAFLLGLTVDDFPKEYAPMIVNFHAIIGLIVLLLAATRICWRSVHTPPPLPDSGGSLLHWAAKVGHGLLYLLMLLVPLIGIPTLAYRGRGLDFGLFAIPPLVSRAPDIFHPLTELHQLAAWALVLVALGHIAAAIYHQHVLRDQLISRMLPWKSGRVAARD